MRRARSGPARRLVLVTAAAALALGAGPAKVVRVDNWATYSTGRLELAAIWHRYPAESTPFTHPPAIVQDDGRPVLQLMTRAEAMRIGRPLKIDAKKTPWLVWEWKPLVLPESGDVRNPKRNDQAGRVAVMFEGMKAVLYVWDTTAPVGAELEPDSLDMFQRALIVIRSGAQGVGKWHQERRDVHRDFVRVFGEEPRSIKWIGFESHSNDTNTRTSVLFGRVQFETR